MDSERIYWGVMCKTCSEPVAFGCPDQQECEMESICAKPGAIRCAKGHNHIYFPRDFKFFASAIEIPEAVTRANREAHKAVNPAPPPPSEEWHGVRWAPEPEQGASGNSVNEAKAGQKMQASGTADPRRETAQA